MRYGLDASEGISHEDLNSFPAQSSVLDEEALFQRVVRDYDIPQPQTCRFLDCRAAEKLQSLVSLICMIEMSACLTRALQGSTVLREIAGHRVFPTERTT